MHPQELQVGAEIKKADLMPLTPRVCCRRLKGHRVANFTYGSPERSFILSCSECKRRRGGVTSCLNSKVSSVSPGPFASTGGDSYLFRCLLVTNLGHPFSLQFIFNVMLHRVSSGLERDEDKWQQKWFPHYRWEGSALLAHFLRKQVIMLLPEETSD